MSKKYIYEWVDPKADAIFRLYVYKPYLTETYTGEEAIPEGTFIPKEVSWEYDKLPVGCINNCQFSFNWDLSNLDRTLYSELFNLIKRPSVEIDDTAQPEPMKFQMFKLGTVYELSVSKNTSAGEPYFTTIYRGMDRGKFYDNYDMETNIVECKADSLEYVILSQMVNPRLLWLNNSLGSKSAMEYAGVIYSYVYNPLFHSDLGWGYYNLYAAAFEPKWKGLKFWLMSLDTLEESIHKIYMYSFFRITNQLTYASNIDLYNKDIPHESRMFQFPLLTFCKRDYTEAGEPVGTLTLNDIYVDFAYTFKGVTGEAQDGSVKSMWDYIHNLFEGFLFRMTPNPAGDSLKGKLLNDYFLPSKFIIKKENSVKITKNADSDAVVGKCSCSLHNNVGSDVINFSAKDSSSTSNSQELILPLLYNNTVGADSYEKHTTLAESVDIRRKDGKEFWGRNYIKMNSPSRCWNFFYLDTPDQINFWGAGGSSDENSEFYHKVPISVHENVYFPQALIDMAEGFVYPQDVVLEDRDKRSLTVINKDLPDVTKIADIQVLRGLPRAVSAMAKCLFSKSLNTSLEVTLDFNTLYSNANVDYIDDFTLFTGYADMVQLNLTEWEPLYSDRPQKYYITGCTLDFESSTYTLKLYGIA